MSPSSFSDHLASRLEAAGLTPSQSVVAGCLDYLDLLARWNRTINLTSLPLNPADSNCERTIDKLLVEPLVAAQLLNLPGSAWRWVDLGSGGGSPAIPLRLCVTSGELLMVESRSRKCAFLGEVVRSIGLPRTRVSNVRFDALEADGNIDMVSVRAVRFDDEFINIISRLLTTGGHLLSFGAEPPVRLFVEKRSAGLPDGSRVRLYEFTSVPRGTLPGREFAD